LAERQTFVVEGLIKTIGVYFKITGKYAKGNINSKKKWRKKANGEGKIVRE